MRLAKSTSPQRFTDLNPLRYQVLKDAMKTVRAPRSTNESRMPRVAMWIILPPWGISSGASSQEMKAQSLVTKEKWNVQSAFRGHLENGKGYKCFERQHPESNSTCKATGVAQGSTSRIKGEISLAEKQYHRVAWRSWEIKDLLAKGKRRGAKSIE